MWTRVLFLGAMIAHRVGRYERVLFLSGFRLAADAESNIV